MEECFECKVDCPDYYQLDFHKFCGSNCFTEYYNKKAAKLNVRPKKKSPAGPGDGRIKKAPRKNPRRTKSSKRRI